MLKVNSVSKIIKDKKILNGISFSLNFGQICGLLGPNGAGKTTSFYIIAGLAKSDYGWIAVSCKSNLRSIFRKLSTPTSGEWTAPKPGPISGGASLIRKAKCYE